MQCKEIEITAGKTGFRLELKYRVFGESYSTNSAVFYFTNSEDMRNFLFSGKDGQEAFVDQDETVDDELDR